MTSSRPPAATSCISRFEGGWYVGHWLEGSSRVTLVKTTPMPGEGFAPQEHERAKKRGYMSRRVPACEVEAYPVILYKGEGAVLKEMDPEADTFRVSLQTTFWTGVGSQTAARLDGWAVVNKWDMTLASPYMDPEDPRLELVPGLPFQPGVLPEPKAPATWPPRPPGEPSRRLRFVAQHRGVWYVAVWREGDEEATLLKSARMPGEGFTAVDHEPGRSLGVMGRRVPADEVQPFRTVTYQGGKVQLGAMDPEASTLRVSLVAPYFATSGEKSTGLMASWKVLDASAQLVESPFMEPSDRRIHLVAGLPLVI